MLQSSPAIQFPSDIKKYPQSEIPSTSSSPYQKRPEKMKLQQQQQQQSPRSSILTPPPTPGLFTTSRTPSLSSSSLQTNTSDPLLDHSHLRPGQNASLLSYDQTINMYRENAKKTNDTNIQCDFAMFLVEAGGSDHLLEAEKILKQVAVRGHGESQYYLGNMYANGMLNKKRHGQPEFEKAFPLFVQSAKHHHPDAAYRTAKCYEEGLGTRRDKGKAVQFYRKAATLSHPGAMYRLGLAQLKGDLGQGRNIRDGHKWLKRSSECASRQYPHALHELGLLHEKGLDSVIFVDLKYAVSLYHDAAHLGYAPSAYRLGECYEFGKLSCKVDPVLSIHFYGLAAEQHHAEACLALTAWYLVGVPGRLEPSEQQAYAWALRAAQLGNCAKAEYALAYFMDMGIGTDKDASNAMLWYQKAAQHGDKRALSKLEHRHQPPSRQGSFLQKATSFLKKS